MSITVFALFMMATNCSSLADMKMSGVTVTSAQTVEPGNAQFKNDSSFCRVSATLKPTSDSDIKIEVWLPPNWNGKYQAVGNGGWGGSISYNAMIEALRTGYATSS